MKLINITWSYENVFDNNTILYKSYLKHNDPQNFINIHFNRNNYKTLEEKFNNRFGYQYEFLLYRILLLLDQLNTIQDDKIIFADSTDVVCLGNICDLKDIPNDKIIFSSEQHRYPNEQNITNWTPSYLYSKNDEVARNYINAGLSVGFKHLYNELLKDCIDNIFSKEYKNFGGDQGVYTYYYINRNKLIYLDKDTKYFLSTYSRSPSDFYNDNGRIVNILNNNKPIFIHDNGWNYGSPKFIERFNLI